MELVLWIATWCFFFDTNFWAKHSASFFFRHAEDYVILHH
jgi:hypothetical protein